MSSPKAPDACPLCGKPAAAAHRPFCGPGCRDRDLLQWFGEGYRIAGPPLDDADMEGLDSAPERPL